MRLAAAETARRRFTFNASPVQNKADGEKLRAALRSVEAIRSFEPTSGKKGVAKVVITAELETPDSIIAAAKEGGFELKLTKDEPVNGGGTTPPNGGDPPPAAGSVRFKATPVKTTADAKRLREALLQVEGATNLSIKSAKKGNVADLEVSGTATPAAISVAAKEAGFTVTVARN